MRRGEPGPGRAALCALLAALLVAVPRTSLALGPFEKNHPRVEEGLQAYEEGRYEDALQAFEAAGRELPGNAVVEFDRGNALYKLRRLDEAREAYHRVAEMDRGQLQQKDYYNLGNALAELGQNKDAAAAYRKALVLDPTDDLARHNLEVVLRNLPPPKQQPKRPQPDAGQQDAGQDAGSDAGQDGGRGSQDGGSGDGGTGDGGMGAGPGDGGTDGGLRRDAGQDGGSGSQREKELADGGTGDEGEDEQEEAAPDGGQEQRPMQELNKKDVDRLLDSMKQSEKNLQLWRFQQRKKAKSRKDNAKDW